MIGVRPATAQDSFGIAHVHVETWRATYPTLLPHEYLSKHLSIDTRAIYWQRALQLGRTDESVFVATEGFDIVGFTSVGPARKLPKTAPQSDARWGEVFTLYVLPDYQEQGIGRMLLANGLAELVERGFDAAMLWVLDGNPARFFYEAMGGAAIGRDVEKFAGARLEEICYAWRDLPAAMTRLADQTHRQRAQS